MNVPENMMDPAYVMGMGARRITGPMESLEDSALIQFQEFTGFGNGNDATNQLNLNS